MFVSDNESCVCPEVMAALETVNSGDAAGYGGDDATHELKAAFSRYFETDVVAFPAGTGTAANALSLALAAPRYGAIFCHEKAHIETTECGAVEACVGGGKLVLLAGDGGRISLDAFRAALAAIPRGRPQAAPPAAVSLTQGAEAGTIYSLDEIRGIADLAHLHGLLVHMDGARFSNALVALGCTPAEMSWKAGVDILAYGATKNGAMCAEAVVIFNKELARQEGFLRRRNGQLYSKMRYLSAQLLAMLENGVAERNAAQANAIAASLAKKLLTIPGARLLYPVEINEIYVALPEPALKRLEARGIKPLLRASPQPHVRFVTAWNSTAEAVERFVAIAAGNNAPAA